MVVTCFETVKDKKPTVYAKYIAVLDFIKNNEKNRKKVLALRESQNYKEEKLTRPCVAWAGKFSHRGNDGIQEFSQLMYFDIDEKIPRKEIEAIPEVIAIWESLSGRGWGFIIGTVDVNKSNFVSTYNGFIDQYQLPIDKLKDISRLNFLSSDPELYYNKNHKLFKALEPITEKPVVYNKSITFLDLINKEQLWLYLCNRALDKTLEQGLDYFPGSRHNFVVKFFSKTNFYGVPYEYAWNWLSQLYCLSEHARKTSEDIYRRYYDSFGGMQRIT
ncbi:MAG: hypothetical protein NZZ41_02605 [Candidatus Dojkabacteria bacterium]|nr:hypothetical protein [Candidatus Dojkabacteria bacterium]